MKTCSRCRQTKPLDSFAKKKSLPDGLQHHCRSCCSEYTAAWRANNLERKRRMDREYAMRHSEQAKERARKWNAENKEQKKITGQNYREINKESIKVSQKKHREENKEQIKLNKQKYRQENKEKLKIAARKYRQENKGIVLADRAFRKARKRQATPPWLTKIHKEAMRIFYQAAVYMSEQTGIKHHVDHIYPLVGKNSCGLHVPWNLQILTATENLKKGNR